MEDPLQIYKMKMEDPLQVYKTKMEDPLQIYKTKTQVKSRNHACETLGQGWWKNFDFLVQMTAPAWIFFCHVKIFHQVS